MNNKSCQVSDLLIPRGCTHPEGVPAVSMDQRRHDGENSKVGGGSSDMENPAAKAPARIACELTPRGVTSLAKSHWWFDSIIEFTKHTIKTICITIHSLCPAYTGFYTCPAPVQKLVCNNYANRSPRWVEKTLPRSSRRCSFMLVLYVVAPNTTYPNGDSQAPNLIP